MRNCGSFRFATTRVICANPAGCPVIIDGSTSGLGACFLNGVKIWEDLIVAGVLPREVRQAAHLLHGTNALLVSSRSDQPLTTTLLTLVDNVYLRLTQCRRWEKIGRGPVS